MKEHKTEFYCDECGERFIVQGDSEGKVKYPYKAGWCYLYNLQIKIPNEKTNFSDGISLDAKDKHFCCKAHLIKYLLEKL